MTQLADVAVGGKVTAAIENADRAEINKTERLVTPTSVSTGSIDTYGAVTFSGASAISVNGCFTSAFEWYRVEFDVTTSGAATLSGALRLSGTDAATAYDNQRISGVDASPTTAQTLNQTAFRVTVTGITGEHSGTIKFRNPALAVSTKMEVFAGASANPMTSTTGSVFIGYLSHRTLTAYDGFTITPSTGNITGTIRVYGII